MYRPLNWLRDRHDEPSPTALLEALVAVLQDWSESSSERTGLDRNAQQELLECITKLMQKTLAEPVTKAAGLNIRRDEVAHYAVDDEIHRILEETPPPKDRWSLIHIALSRHGFTVSRQEIERALAELELAPRERHLQGLQDSKKRRSHELVGRLCGVAPSRLHNIRLAVESGEISKDDVERSVIEKGILGSHSTPLAVCAIYLAEAERDHQAADLPRILDRLDGHFRTLEAGYAKAIEHLRTRTNTSRLERRRAGYRKRLSKRLAQREAVLEALASDVRTEEKMDAEAWLNWALVADHPEEAAAARHEIEDIESRERLAGELGPLGILDQDPTPQDPSA
ncbi:MAG: hypothetical protein FD161_4814 [Limisphaerales bacterium]|nr:MAG: hypothetical protein FD161_4814 [Limisphaerales bacterium]